MYILIKFVEHPEIADIWHKNSKKCIARSSTSRTDAKPTKKAGWPRARALSGFSLLVIWQCRCRFCTHGGASEWLALTTLDARACLLSQAFLWRSRQNLQNGVSLRSWCIRAFVIDRSLLIVIVVII